MGSYLLASAEEAWYNYVYQAAGSLELYSGTSRVSECVCVCVCVCVCGHIFVSCTHV